MISHSSAAITRGHQVERERSLDAADVEGHPGLGVVVGQRLGDRAAARPGCARPSVLWTAAYDGRTSPSASIISSNAAPGAVAREDVLHGLEPY